MIGPEIAAETSEPRTGVMGPDTAVEAAGGAHRRQELISCGGCPARWTGQSRAHCGACHRTFAGVTYFDQHRRAFTCVDPAGIEGMREVDGIWRGPEMTEEAKLARFGGRS